MGGILLLALVALQLPVPAASQSGTVTGTIGGVVNSAAAKQGIPDVQLTIEETPRLGGPPPIRLNQNTDSGGHFSFPNLPPGRYTITAQRDGYFSLQAATSSYTGFATLIVTSTQAKRDFHVDITLVAGGAIGGKVRDAQDRPIIRASVRAMQTVYQRGRRSIAGVRTTSGSLITETTNDRGEYVLSGLPPGEYFVEADPPADTTAGAQATFYPGTAAVAGAVPVVVRSGQETKAIDFGIQHASFFNVSGKISVSLPRNQIPLDSEADRGAFSFYLIPRTVDDAGQPMLLSNTSVAAGPGGVTFDFKLEGIPPGDYYLYPALTIGDSGGGTSSYATRIPVQVNDRDVVGLEGVIREYPNVNVQVTVRGATASAETLAPFVPRVELRSEEPLPPSIARSSQLSQRTAPQMAFRNIFPATYQVYIPLIRGLYLEDIRQGGVSVYRDGRVAVTSEESLPIEIVLNTGEATIEGMVRDARGQQVAATVVLVPHPTLRSNSTLYRRLDVSFDSRFLFRGISPGDYKLFVWQSLAEGAEESEEVLARYENFGRPITIAPGAVIDLVLNPIPSDTR